MAPGTDNGDLHAARSESSRGHIVDGRAVHRNHIPKLFAVALHQFANAAKVPFSFFADVGHKKNRTARVELGIAHDPRKRWQGGEACAVVRNPWCKKLVSLAPHLYLRACRKNRVQVGRDDNELAFGAAGALANHISRLI